MALGQSFFSDLGGAVSDIFGGQARGAALRLKARGDQTEAQNYDLASTLAGQNEEFTKQSTAIKEQQEQRQIFLGQGNTEASVASSGFAESGSALDLLREGAQQGAITKQVLGQQGLITEAGFEEQKQAYTNMASAARTAAQEEEDMANKSERNGWLTGGIRGVAAIASLFTGGNIASLAESGGGE